MVETKMKIKSFTLGDAPFNYVISFPFPDRERRIIEESIKSVNCTTPKEILDVLESELAKKIEPKGYKVLQDSYRGLQTLAPRF